MAIKKSELYSSLWKMCDKLRGGMDASQYKDYVLVLLFVKYVSDRYAGKADSLIEVPKGGGFDDFVGLVGRWSRHFPVRHQWPPRFEKWTNTPRSLPASTRFSSNSQNLLPGWT
jgi:hypothetical protein